MTSDINSSRPEIPTDQFQLISKYAADMVCLHKPDGTYEYISPSVEQILGYKPEELIGTNPYDLFHPQDLERIKNKLNKEGWSAKLAKSMQYRIKRKDGKYIWFETATESITNKQGEIVKLRTGSRDITERKRLELLLKETNALASVGGWEIDLETDELTWTEEVYNIYELPSGSPISVEKAISYYAPEAESAIKDAIEHAIETGEGYDIELPFTSAKGNKKWVRSIGRVYNDENGEPIKLSGVFQDLTERKQIETQLETRNEELKRLHNTTSKVYSVIGHDLRSPINAITGFADLLMDDLTEHGEEVEGARQKLEIIYNSAHNVARLLNDLLNWARIQTGDLHIHVEEFSVAKIVHENIELLSISAKNKGVNFSFSSHDKFFVEADERMVTTIVRNLLSNAVKYSEAGDTIQVQLGKYEDHWFLSVKDEGIGMSREKLESLSGSEMNKSKRGTANEKGTGIGLTLCKELAEMQGGTIEMESELGKGSKFTLKIPRSIEAQEQ